MVRVILLYFCTCHNLRSHCIHDLCLGAWTIMHREDEESEWGSEDEEPGVRHGEEFQVRSALLLMTNVVICALPC